MLRLLAWRTSDSRSLLRQDRTVQGPASLRISSRVRKIIRFARWNRAGAWPVLNQGPQDGSLGRAPIRSRPTAERPLPARNEPPLNLVRFGGRVGRRMRLSGVG